MDFFEALRERAHWKTPKRTFHGYEYDTWARGRQDGVTATIEALKEMMVGEPMRGKLAHSDTIVGHRYTDVFFNEQFDDFCISAEWIDTDGEEVVVMVFRREKKE